MDDAKGQLIVGYIGLGDMGQAMALNLAEKGWPLVVHDLRPDRCAPLAALGAAVASSPREVGQACDILCLCVVDAAQIEAVLFGEAGAAQALKKGAVVVGHSTAGAPDCQRIAERLAPLGLDYVDAPVSGGAGRGRTGELTVAVGGARAAVERVMPLLNDIGSSVSHLGGVGAGQTGKLLNNALYYVQLSLIDEVVRTGVALGLDREAIQQVIDTGTAGSWASRHYGEMIKRDGAMFAWESDYPGGVIGIARKDVRLILARLAEGGFGTSRIARLAGEALETLGRPLERD